MGNKVSFVIVAQDQYSRIANRINRATVGMQIQFIKLKTKTSALNTKFKTLVFSLGAIKRKMNEGVIAAGRFGRKMRNAGALATAAISLPILLLTKSIKDAARDAEETRSKFATVFSGISNTAETTADNLAKSFGLAGTEARKLLGDTGDLLSGFGFGQKSALDLSTQVQELAVDLASFTNIEGGAERASAALTKALLGERESIKLLGIAILEKDVKDRVASLAAKGMRFETMRQAKAIATLQLATEQSKNAIGDFARTSQSLANQERITAAKIQDLKEKFGRILLPVALKLTKAIGSLVDWLSKLSPKTQKTILVVAGLAAVIGPLILIVGTFLTILPVLTAGIAGLGAVITFATGPIGLVAAAFAGGLFIGKRLADFLRGFPAVWRGIGTAVAIILNPLESIKTLWEKIQGWVASLMGKLREMPVLWNAIGFAVDLLLAPLKVALFVFEKLMQFTTGLREAISDLAGGALDKLLSLFGKKGFEGDINTSSLTRSQVDVNMNAPPGVINDVKTKTTGSRNMNIGVNMQEALP